MKKLSLITFTIFLCVFCINSAYCQNSNLPKLEFHPYVTPYAGNANQELNSLGQQLNNRFEKNQNYKDRLQNWIFTLKNKTSNTILIEKLNYYELLLDEIEKKGDFENQTLPLRDIDNGIKSAIFNYEN